MWVTGQIASTERERFPSMQNTTCTDVIEQRKEGHIKDTAKRTKGKKALRLCSSTSRWHGSLLIVWHPAQDKHPLVPTVTKLLGTERTIMQQCGVQNAKCPPRRSYKCSPDLIWCDKLEEYCDGTHRKQFALHNCISWSSAPVSAILCRGTVMKPVLKCRAPNTGRERASEGLESGKWSSLTVK